MKIFGCLSVAIFGGVLGMMSSDSCCVAMPPSISANIFVRGGFWQNGFFADFHTFSPEFFSSCLWGKSAQKNPSFRKIPDKTLQISYNQNPRQFLQRLLHTLFGTPSEAIVDGPCSRIQFREKAQGQQLKAESFRHFFTLFHTFYTFYTLFTLFSGCFPHNFS